MRSAQTMNMQAAALQQWRHLMRLGCQHEKEGHECRALGCWPAHRQQGELLAAIALCTGSPASSSATLVLGAGARSRVPQACM